MPQFCLLDPALTGAAGHHGDFARNVLDAAQAAGCSPVLAGHHKCAIDACGAWPVRRVFRDGLWTHQAGHAGLRLTGYAVSALRRAPQRAATIAARCERRRDQWRGRRFAADLDRILRDLDPREGDVLFVPNATCAEALGLARLLQTSSSARRPTWHLEFRFDLPARGAARADHARDAGRLSQALRDLRAGPAGDRVFYYTDTDELTAGYSALGAGRFATLPIPVDPQVAPRAFRTAESRSVLTKGRIDNPSDAYPPGPLVAAYIGDARVEKGFAQLPALIARVWPDLVESGKLRFVIQANCRAGRGERAARDALRQLARFPSPQVELRPEPLGTDKYRAHLLAADVLILPYGTKEYAARSSGVMSEALAAGIPTIVPEGTWLGAQLGDGLRRTGAESSWPRTEVGANSAGNHPTERREPAATPAGAVGAVFDDVPDGLALALREIVAHYPHYQQTAAKFSEAWRRAHNPRRLIDRLLEFATAAPPALRPAG